MGHHRVCRRARSAASLGAAAAIAWLASVSAVARAEAPAPRPLRGDVAHLRLGLGAARMSPRLSFDTGDNGQTAESEYAGTAIAGELFAGAHVTEAIAVGGGVSSFRVSDASYGGPYGATGAGGQGLQVTHFGPFVDIYPSPTVGAYLQLFTGLSTFRSERTHVPEANRLDGFFVAGGVGYELSAFPHGRIGVLGRLHYSWLGNTIDRVHTSTAFVTPALYLTLLVH